MQAELCYGAIVFLLHAKGELVPVGSVKAHNAIDGVAVRRRRAPGSLRPVGEAARAKPSAW